MKSTTIKLDIAKKVIEVFMEDGGTQGVERKRPSRKKMLLWVGKPLPAFVEIDVWHPRLLHVSCLSLHQRQDTTRRGGRESGERAKGIGFTVSWICHYFCPLEFAAVIQQTW